MTARLHWDADVILNDGGIASLRPVSPEDTDELRRFYARVSDKSKYLRFFGAHPELTDDDIRQWLDTDEYDRVTLVVTEYGNIVGVATYGLVTRLHPARVAEVAFLVQDSHHGRGVGNIMLEHLAEIGREGKIERFVAEMLPRNRSMVQTFANAGYSVTPELADGFISVDFTIDATETSNAVMERRELRAEANSIRRIVCPSSVAVVGPAEHVGMVIASLTSSGFDGDIRIVTSSDDGQSLAHAISSCGKGADLFCIPQTEELNGTLDDVFAAVSQQGGAAVVVLSSNVSPILSQRHSRNVVNTARDHGLRALGPAALGVINTLSHLNVTPAPMPRQGRIAVFTQSAGVAAIMLANALEHRVGISSFIAAGSFADVTANDVMQYWSMDDTTDICLLSPDTIGNPRKFFRIIRRLSLVKHVIVFMPSRALQAHSTPALADGVFDDVLRRSGAMVVSRRETMLNVAQLLARQPCPAGPRVAVISNSSGLVSQMDSAARRFSLEPTPLLIAGSLPEGMVATVEKAMANLDIDAVVVTIVEAGSPIIGEASAALRAIASSSTSKPVLGSFVGFHGSAATHEPAGEGQGQLPVFGNYADALEALSLVVCNEHQRAQARPQPEDESIAGDGPAAHEIVQEFLRENPDGGWATAQQCAEILELYGMRVVGGEGAGEVASAISVRCVEDRTIGPIVSVGIAGIASDVLGDVAYAAPPVHRRDASSMIDAVRAMDSAALSNTARERLEATLMQVATLGDDIPPLAEIALRLRADATVADARIRIAPHPEHRDPAIRALA